MVLKSVTGHMESNHVNEGVCRKGEFTPRHHNLKSKLNNATSSNVVPSLCNYGINTFLHQIN